MGIKKKGIVRINFWNGFGNNMFQYVFCRLFAKKHGLTLSHKKGLPIGIKPKPVAFPKGVPIKVIKKTRRSDTGIWNKYLEDEYTNKKSYVISGYFEDYTLYKPYLNKIRSWFSTVEKTNFKDLVVHIRLGDRLLCETSHGDFVSVDSYKEAIEKFNFDRLYIVTDSKKWTKYTKKDIKKLHSSTHRKSMKREKSKMVSTDRSLEYVNSLIEGLSCYDPILQNSDLINDFNFIRLFDNILIHNSTFAWWAAVLSKATRVGVYGPWKQSKGDSKNKNLGQADYPGWFSWK